MLFNGNIYRSTILNLLHSGFRCSCSILKSSISCSFCLPWRIDSVGIFCIGFPKGISENRKCIWRGNVTVFAIRFSQLANVKRFKQYNDIVYVITIDKRSKTTFDCMQFIPNSICLNCFVNESYVQILSNFSSFSNPQSPHITVEHDLFFSFLANSAQKHGIKQLSKASNSSYDRAKEFLLFE